MMDENEMTTSLYESEAEQTRERIASTVDHLQTRLNPRNMMNDAVGSLQDRGSDLLDSARMFVREHPVALSVAGAAVGLLLLNRNRFGGRDSYSYDAYEDVYGGDMDDGYDATADNADNRPGLMRRGLSRVRSGASNAGSVVSDRASAARGYTSETLRSARDRTSDYASRARVRAGDARRYASDSYDANPLTGALVGIAAGALLGLLLPRTRREDELLGETRDRLADAAKSAARAASDTARRQLDEMGVNADAAKAKLGEIGQQAKEVARTAGQAAASEAKARAGTGTDAGTTQGTIGV
jgi:ElaB/YqjD/DUF883 family membrane-anchored ribosome-binding protein